jgi:flagellar motility protein MotE (MotC chaperone)
MSLDFNTLALLRQNHPAWRLLDSPHAPLVVSFLHRVFIQRNERIIAQADLVEALEDDLFALREQLGAEAFPRAALQYLNDWAGNDKGWLRKFYRQDSDEPYFDLTPATEKAIAWLGTLSARAFVGTESRLLTLFELLRQINAGTEADPQTRISELLKRRDEIDAEIARVRDGDIPLLDDTALKDRFQQFMAVSRELLSDFREVEHNFRALDRGVRERIALWEGSKGELLEDIMGEREAIASSDQGRSFRAFWDFLMSSERQQEFSDLLERVVALPAVAELKPDARTRRAHYDWLEAGEHTQRTVAQLSQQLRRFLDDRAWLENRRIIDILRGIESKALGVRATPPKDEFISIDSIRVDIELPMERPLYTPARKPHIADMVLDADEVDVDAAVLFSQVVVDKTELSRHIRRALQRTAQVTLRELCERRPLQHGLAELVAYLELANEGFKSTMDESAEDIIGWWSADPDGRKKSKQARLPRVIFVR